jgi:hypothetical protein
VQLTAFTASPTRSNEVLLTWQTATEQNSDYFVVERSSNQHSFTSVGTVKATGVASSYSFTDATPARGLSYYRLKKVDKDGAVQYTNLVSANLVEKLRVVLFPNPSKGIVQVTTGMATMESVIVRVTDISGNLVYSKPHQGPRFSVDLTRLPSGKYVISVNGERQQLLLVR